MAKKQSCLPGCIAWPLGILVGFALLNAMCGKHDPPQVVAAPAVYVPTASERAASAKQAASDAKFWAAKNAKEQAEVNSYNKTQEQEPLRDARSDAMAEIYKAQLATAARNAALKARAEQSTTQGTTRTGAVCRDGTSSDSTGRGACSGHGGVKHWIYN